MRGSRSPTPSLRSPAQLREHAIPGKNRKRIGGTRGGNSGGGPRPPSRAIECAAAELVAKLPLTGKRKFLTTMQGRRIVVRENRTRGVSGLECAVNAFAAEEMTLE